MIYFSSHWRWSNGVFVRFDCYKTSEVVKHAVMHILLTLKHLLIFNWTTCWFWRHSVPIWKANIFLILTLSEFPTHSKLFAESETTCWLKYSAFAVWPNLLITFVSSLGLTDASANKTVHKQALPRKRA